MKQNKLTKEQKEELFEMYKTFQYSYKELANKFNKSVSSVSCLLMREGLKGKFENNHFRKYPINQDYFNVIDSEEKSYFLGFLYADGCNHYNSTKISMFLKEEDKDILIKLNNLIQPTKPLTYRKQKIGTNQFGMQISNKQISDKLNELGCIPRKTFTLDFPNNNQVPEKYLLPFLRGYFDGDGWLGKNDISITSSILFCNKLSNFLFNKFQITTKHKVKNKVIELCFSRKDVKLFLDLLYKSSNIHLDRKYQRYMLYHNNNFNTCPNI